MITPVLIGAVEDAVGDARLPLPGPAHAARQTLDHRANDSTVDQESHRPTFGHFTWCGSACNETGSLSRIGSPHFPHVMPTLASFDALR